MILPNTITSSNYPRELYAGIIRKMEKEPTAQNRVLFTVQEFFKLDAINTKVKEFLCNKTPPQGNKIITIWTEVQEEENDELFVEGNRNLREHMALERNQKLAKKAKELRLQETNKLECEICKFNFKDVYGEIGIGFIEAHHKKPLSEINRETTTKISDLALVCSNCHRMLHRGKPNPSIEYLKNIFR